VTPEDYFKKVEDTILRNQELEKENQELKNKTELLEKENEDLKNRLLYYENPNTPPSARQIEKADKTPTENIPTSKKRGAPIGHKGATRPTKEPEETKEVIADHCEKCNSPNIEKLDTCETSIMHDFRVFCSDYQINCHHLTIHMLNSITHSLKSYIPIVLNMRILL
jgi:hypothetical protein